MRGGLGLPGLLFEVTTLRAGPQFPGFCPQASASWLRSIGEGHHVFETASLHDSSIPQDGESEHFPLVPPCALQVFLDPPKELSEFPSEAGI